MDVVAVEVVVSGDVQGVFFRAGAASEARRIGGISGWVRNNPDGSVEVIAEGERKALDSLLDWCSHGPAGAAVSGLKHEWLAYSGEFRDFTIKYG